MNIDNRFPHKAVHFPLHSSEIYAIWDKLGLPVAEMYLSIILYLTTFPAPGQLAGSAPDQQETGRNLPPSGRREQLPQGHGRLSARETTLQPRP